MITYNPLPGITTRGMELKSIPSGNPFSSVQGNTKGMMNKSISHFFVALLILIAGVSVSCENKVDNIPVSNVNKLPAVTGKDVETVYLDSGILQLVMTAPLLEQFDNTAFPYTEFKSGINVIFYDGKSEPVGSVTAKYAKFTETDKTWELRDSVVVVNDINEHLETELLYWDQDKDLIHTDRFVKMTSEDQVMQGFGFESDSRLNHRKIKKVSARIYFNDEE